MTRRTALVGAIGSGLPGGAVAAPRRPRIVSLSLCLDAILVRVADRSQIAALTHYARDPQQSTIVEIARSLPYTHQTAEEVVALRPDIVLASRHTASSTRHALERLGIRVEAYGRPRSVAESLEQVRAVAGLAGDPAQGERSVAEIEAAVRRAAAGAVRPARSAVIYQSNGLTPGPGSLADELLRLAGFENRAARYGVKNWARVPLERLLADPPDILFAGEAAPGARTWADRIITHPALASAAGRMTIVTLPERLLYCGGPSIVEAMACLSAARGRRRAA